MSRRSRAVSTALTACAAVGLLLPQGGGQALAATQAPAYLDTSYSFEERAADLVARLTPREKAAQLSTSNAPAVPRLGVQSYSYWNEMLHGINQVQAPDNNGPGTAPQLRGYFPRATSFPTSLSASLTWNPDLVHREAAAISDEARGYVDKSLFGKDLNNIGQRVTDYGSLSYFAPTVNLLRDPRWGRADETFGEDVLLTSRLGAAYLNGAMGRSTSGQAGRYLKVITTLKHFALNTNESLPQTRMSTNAVADDATIRDYYTAQFRALAPAATGLMPSYNAINGTPAVANSYLLTTLARRTFGFTGATFSDCGAFGTVYRAKNPTPAGPAIWDGHDWAPSGWDTNHGDESAVWTKRGTGTRLTGQAGALAWGLRAGTQVNCPGASDDPMFVPIVRDLFGQENAYRYVEEAINAGELTWDLVDEALRYTFTLRFATGEFDPVDAQPYTRLTKQEIESDEHVALARTVASSALVLLQNRQQQSGRPTLPADPSTLRKVVVLGNLADEVTLGGYSGMPTKTVSAREGITAALRTANPATQVVFDAAATSSTAGYPAFLTPGTAQHIRTADLVLVMVGTDGDTNGESKDRSTLAMPGNYSSLLRQVGALGNPRTVVYTQAAGPVDLSAVSSWAGALLFSAPNGQQQGAALADVLFGSVNPSGRLSFTWPKNDSQVPAMSNYGITPAATGGLGRTYRYSTTQPAYPFGHGLSYTQFSTTPLTLDQSTVSADGTVTASTTVTNTGSVTGSTVAQVYASGPAGSIAGVQQPTKRLVAFARTADLKPGASQTVRLPVRVADLASYDQAAGRLVVPTGTWTLSVGPDAATVASSAALQVSTPLTPRVQVVSVLPRKVVWSAGQTLDLQARNPWLADITAGSSQPGRNVAATTADRVVAAARNDQTFADLSQATVQYASNRPEVASVSSRGVVTMRSPGVATITVTVDGVSGSVPVVVR